MVVVEYEAMAVIAFFMANRANIMFTRCCRNPRFFRGLFCVGKSFFRRAATFSAFRAFQAITLFIVRLASGCIILEFGECLFNTAF